MAKSKNVLAVPSVISREASEPDQFIPIEEVARRLHADVTWVREKIRRRSPQHRPPSLVV
jgi:hypothetical protein